MRKMMPNGVMQSTHGQFKNTVYDLVDHYNRRRTEVYLSGNGDRWIADRLARLNSQEVASLRGAIGQYLAEDLCFPGVRHC